MDEAGAIEAFIKKHRDEIGTMARTKRQTNLHRKGEKNEKYKSGGKDKEHGESAGSSKHEGRDAQSREESNSCA